MDLRKVLACVLFSFFLQAGSSQNLDTDSVLNCCEGDILFLLDSSGSVSSFEFSRMLSFLSELIRPFSLGPEQVGVSLLQVGTEPHLEFGFGTYSTQHGLQEALRRTKQLGGDTNTEGALIFAKQRLLRQDVTGGARPGLPRVLVWLTDGVEPGDVQGPMAELREMGVAVLVVSTGRGNYQVLSDVVSPPAEDHLYFVDIDDMNIITEDLRNAIIRIILAKRLQVRDISSTSAVLHWRPVLTGTGYYDIRFGPVYSGQEGPGGGPGTRPGTGLGHYQRITRPAQSSTAQLTHLRPGTTYNVTLIPESNLEFYNKLSTMFTTRPDEPEPEAVQSPALVTVSESTGNSVRVSWAPLQPDVVQSYQVEYSALPTGKLHVVTTGNLQNSTVLANLLPDTQYLVTVSARHFSGTDKAMSVKVCTQEISPALSDLKLTTMGSDSVQLRWKGSADGLRGYWVTWEGGFAHTQRSTLHLPPHVLSTTLTNVPPNARVCVSPVYKSTRGDGLCCTAHFSSAAVPWSQRL